LPPKRAQPRRVQFGVGIAGSLGGFPVYYTTSGDPSITWGFGVEAAAALNFGEHVTLRLSLNYTHSENVTSTGDVVYALASPAYYFGRFGLGVGVQAGVGIVSCIFCSGAGLAVGAFGSPIRFRFGDRFTHDLGIDIGVNFITSQQRLTQSQPFGRLSYNFYFL
jgi:hypothetical protein